ncbi:MAG: hypothetical protein JWO35_580 [Candidatus Saccharibacteria bacterium]|nr:hypothetical protein [Candidatus Saccharibacteria bacterium]
MVFEKLRTVVDPATIGLPPAPSVEQESKPSGPMYEVIIPWPLPEVGNSRHDIVSGFNRESSYHDQIETLYGGADDFRMSRVRKEEADTYAGIPMHRTAGGLIVQHFTVFPGATHQSWRTSRRHYRRCLT